MGHNPEMPVQLAEVPRPSWTNYIIPLKNWQEKHIRDQDIQYRAQCLQRSREHLADRGIEVSLLFPNERLPRLFGELHRRGWQASYETGGRGYEVYAEKHYPPSSGMTIQLSATTLVDAATLVVRSAIESDEEHKY